MLTSYGPSLATVIANDAEKDLKEGTGVLRCCGVVALWYGVLQYYGAEYSATWNTSN